MGNNPFNKIPFTQEYLKECLEYNAGIFYYKKRPLKHFNQSKNRTPEHKCNLWNIKNEEKEAGSTCKEGYVWISLDGNRYTAHRLAWLYVYGYDSKFIIDHIEGKNNNIENLRESTYIKNGQNCKVRKDNNTKISGVSFYKNKNKYRVRIIINKKEKYIGYFDSLQDAAIARYNAELENDWMGIKQSSAKKYLIENKLLKDIKK